MFVTDGYNFRNHELGAVLGLSQLPRLDEYIERNKNLQRFIDLLSQNTHRFVIPEYHERCSNFVFLFCVVFPVMLIG